jgi:ubiquinone/menaquinone biosynthesis C-methylase UbiE
MREPDRAEDNVSDLTTPEIIHDHGDRIFARQAIVTRLYDWVLGRVYDFFMDVFAPGYRGTIIRFYKQHLKSLSGIGQILEVGPGTGYVTMVVLDQFPKASLTCVDISTRMLDQVRKRFLRAGTTRPVRLLQGDITRRCGLESGSFDLIVVQSVIEHLPDLSPAIAEIYRLLAPGGTLIVSDICDGFWGRLFAFVFRVRSFTKEQIRRMFGNAGFGDLEFLDYQASFFIRGTLFFLQARKPKIQAQKG